MNRYILILLFLMVLSGCSSTNTLLENLLLASEKPSFTEFYQKKETRVTYQGKLVKVQILQTWEDASTGNAFHELVDSEEGTFYTVINKDMMTLHQKGSGIATVKKVPSLYFSHLLTQKEDTIEYLESLRKTHTLKLIDEEFVSNTKTYHFHASPKESNQLLGEQHLWINQKNWMIMKKKLTLDEKIIEENILAFDDSLRGRSVHFTIPTEENNPIQFIYEPVHEEKDIAFISAPIYLLEIKDGVELLQSKSLLEPINGYRLVYTKNELDYVQLKATEKKGLSSDNKLETDLQIDNYPVSIQPIPNVGFELVFNDDFYEYEVTLFDPLASKIDLHKLLQTFKRRNE